LSDEVLYTHLVDRAVFSVSSGTVLVIQTGKGAALSQLTWFDRNGKPVGRAGATGSYGNVRLSPDGRRVAVDQTNPDGRNVDILILEPDGVATTRLTFDPSAHSTPIWSPSGKQILFSWNRKFGAQLYLKPTDGSGSEEEAISN